MNEARTSQSDLSSDMHRLGQLAYAPSEQAGKKRAVNPIAEATSGESRENNPRSGGVAGHVSPMGLSLPRCSTLAPGAFGCEEADLWGVILVFTSRGALWKRLHSLTAARSHSCAVSRTS